MCLGFISALKYFSLHGLQESLVFHWSTNMHPQWKTFYSAKHHLKLQRKTTGASNVESSYSWNQHGCEGRTLPRKHTVHRCNEWQTKTIPLMTVTSRWCPWGCCQDNTHVLRDRQDILHGLYPRSSVTFRAFTTESDCWEAEPCPLTLAGSFAEHWLPSAPPGILMASFAKN